MTTTTVNLPDIELYESGDKVATMVNAVYRIKASDVTVATDATKGVSPYNTSYGYTNITINTIDASELKEGMVIALSCSGSLVVASSYRNVRIRFGSAGSWIPVFYTTGILGGSSYFTNGATNLIIYKTDIQTSGAFHLMYDANTTYTPMSLGFGYATCTTAEATTAKVATLSSYGLVANGIVAVKFTYAVPASSTLNINSKGAKAIYYNGAAITAGIIQAGDTAYFVYNGSQYLLLGIDKVATKRYTAGTNITISTANQISVSGTVASATNADTLDGNHASAFATSSHTHNYAGSSSAGGAANSVANSLTVGSKTYNGSTAVTVVAADLGLSQALVFKGVSTTALTDGGTENPTVGGTVITTKNVGDVYIYNNFEFLWTSSSKWAKLGDDSSYALKTVSITGSGALSGGGTLADSRTITHTNSGVTAATYGTTATAPSAGGTFTVPSFAVNAYGHITSATNQTVTLPAQITGIKMNGASKGTSGVVDLGTVITAHQSLSNYYTKSEIEALLPTVTRL